MLQNLIVAGVVIAAAIYLLRRFLTKSGSSCGCGCEGCGSAGSCAGAGADGACPSGLHDLRKHKRP